VIAERDRHGLADDAGGDGSLEDQFDPHRVPARDFGRDGVSGLVNIDRAMRARDVSRPGPAEEELALQVLDSLIARVEGRPQRVPDRV
jgi:hypothetical protein